MREVTITISDDLYRYLTFLERQHFIKSKEQALSTALEFYRVFAMHDWLPYVYRMGGGKGASDGYGRAQGSFPHFN